MLMKLVKHDIKSSYRELLPLYMGLLLFALISSLSISDKNQWLGIITVIPFFALIIATSVILTLTTIKLFSNRLYSKEGYLTHTLPVSTLETFLSKIVTAIIWILLTSLVLLLAILIFGGILSLRYWALTPSFPIEFRAFISRIDLGTLIPEILKFLVISFPQIIINIIYTCSVILIAVVIANTSYVSKNKLAVGIIVYLVINFIFSNLNNNFISDWLWFEQNNGFDLNWTNYIIDFIYNAVVSTGLIYCSIWLNDHKLELE